MKDFPQKFETHITDGDLSYGYYEVYYASEIEEWLEELRKTLRDTSSDRTVIQHGNEAQTILRMIDRSVLAGLKTEAHAEWLLPR
jgi:hypothetical protein